MLISYLLEESTRMLKLLEKASILRTVGAQRYYPY